MDLAERKGFEPLNHLYVVNALAVRRLQPLSHLSWQAYLDSNEDYMGQSHTF